MNLSLALAFDKKRISWYNIPTIISKKQGGDQVMVNEIIELLPSTELKAKIKETNHQFKENELLQIIYRYAPTFDARIDLLERFSNIVTSDIAALAKVYIEYERQNFSRFIETTEGFVYELCIKDKPEAYEEKYLCASYQAALVCIDRFYEEYADVNTKETEKSRYRIIKRKVFSENDTFEEDAYAECVLGANKTVLEVSDYRNPADCDSEIMCSECKKICPCRCDDLSFPCFVHNYAVIKYKDYNGDEHFGVNICLEKCDGMAQELYVIPLDSSEIREHRFDADFFDHEHIELPLATLASPDDLDEVMKKNYFDFVEHWSSRT